MKSEEIFLNQGLRFYISTSSQKIFGLANQNHSRIPLRSDCVPVCHQLICIIDNRVVILEKIIIIMDIVKAVQNYIIKMLNEVPGMKVLLLDSETTPIISNVMTQSSLLSHETYLVDRIDNRNRDRMRHLKCICFLRPTSETMQLLVEELRDPQYGDYYLYFSNILKKSAIERLAEVDEHEAVSEVQEYFADYCAINPDFYSLNLSLPLYGDSLNTWDGETLQRVVEGVLAILLSLKKKPLIRYEKMSVMAKRLATEIHYHIQQESQLFYYRKTDTPPILLILDRRNDPVTPLLSQWTYQAMVHELLGIQNGRVNLSDVPDIRPELKEIVLSQDTDPFYKKNMELNLGDLGANIKSYVEEYQSKTKSKVGIESIADMKRFMEEYPEFRKISGNVSKHVTLVSELSRLVEKENLLEVSELEQSLACYEQHASDLKNLQRLIASSKVSDNSKIRLVLLYSLRYEKSPSNSITSLIDELHRHGVSQQKISLIASMIQFAGTDKRQDDLFSNESFLARGKNAIIKGLKGVENVYTQHSPHLRQTIELLLKCKLKETSYPYIEGGTKDRPQDIIIFMVGGATYEEARYVSQINSTTPGVRIVLGGTTVHNSQSFLNEVQDAFHRFPLAGATGTRPTRFGVGGGGVENVYTQHSPHLRQTIELLLKCKLKETSYPYIEGGTKDRPQDIIIFMVGGATYEEARYVSQINSTTPGVRIVLGGTTVHNSQSFLNEVQDAFHRFPLAGATGTRPTRFGVGGGVGMKDG
ncbi:hypothetical protein Glove_405g4 [Diversispora epigaea]|uniref:Vacuolar protein sorting-associated protein 45 n=1 Tax=Diversispora epigaea TaxID=1348612 RepID=A0A397H3L6_9GLOM|nr:hypothetical protein Glove_405g4 [Diversispora epigaea]